MSTEFNIKTEIRISTHSRMLCRDCGEIRRVKEVSDQLLLVCGHTRPASTLPLDPGKVSFEHLGPSRSALGAKLFPAKRDAVLTD